MTTALDLSVFPEQGAFIEDSSSVVGAVCGIGGGKSEAGAIKTLLYCSQHPGALGMVTAPTYKMLTDATMRSVQKVFPQGYYEINKVDMHLKYRNGAEILFRSTDDPERLRGPNLAFAWMDEAALSSEDSFLILQGRLRQPGHPNQLWLTTTPRGFNWVYRRLKRDNAPGYALHQWATSANVFLPKGYLEQLKQSYGEQFALQELGGEFVLMGGGYFDAEALRVQLDDANDPMQTRLSSAVRIWKPRVIGGQYVMGGDTAWGRTGSYQCVTILDYQTGEQVAEIHGRLPLDELAEQSVKLGQEYNNAFAGIEWAGDEDEGQYVVRKMVELGYGEHMYYRDHDQSEPKMPGIVTNSTTRPVMLGKLEEAIRRRAIRIRCKDGVEECMSFIRDEKTGKPTHSEGAHDDHVMSLAFAWHMRDFAKFGTGIQAVPAGHGW